MAKRLETGIEGGLKNPYHEDLLITSRVPSRIL